MQELPATWFHSQHLPNKQAKASSESPALFLIAVRLILRLSLLKVKIGSLALNCEKIGHDQWLGCGQ